MSDPTPEPSRPRGILVADDDLVSRVLVESNLLDLGYAVTTVADGDEALASLLAPDAPTLAILDWEMPGRSGPEVCRALRAARPTTPLYVMLLTVRGDMGDVVAGLRSGANDYLTKPFDRDELAARLEVASGVVALQQALASRVRELEHALAHNKALRGLLPICAWCKKIRDDGNYWRQVEDYVAQHTDARFTHGICPGCESLLDDEAEHFLKTRPGR